MRNFSQTIISAFSCAKPFHGQWADKFMMAYVLQMLYTITHPEMDLVDDGINSGCYGLERTELHNHM